MKFSSSVDSISKENHFLRTMVKFLILADVALTLTVLYLHDRAPVVVERSSRGLEVVRMTQLTRTAEDVNRAIELMLKARFDTGSIAPELFLSKRQMELRITEQQEMKARGLYQSIVFRKAVITKSDAQVEFDRLISIGEVRSAFKTVIKIAFEETDPIELNPYGLKLALANPIEEKKR